MLQAPRDRQLALSLLGGFGLSSIFWLLFHRKILASFDQRKWQMQSVMLPSAADGESGIIRSLTHPETVTSSGQDETLLGLFRSLVSEQANAICAGRVIDSGKRVEWITFAEMNQQITEIAEGISSVVTPRNIVIVGESRFETFLLEYAAFANCAAVVPIRSETIRNFGKFDEVSSADISSQELELIIREGETDILCCTKSLLSQIALLTQKSNSETSQEEKRLRFVVQYEPEVSKADKDKLSEFGVRLLSVAELRQFGTQKIADCAKYGNTARLSCVPTSSTSAYIISVKDGDSLCGTVISHGNSISNAKALFRAIGLSQPHLPPQIYLSHLPLDHPYYRVAHAVVLMSLGGRIVLLSEEASVQPNALLKETFPLVRPTIDFCTSEFATKFGSYVGDLMNGSASGFFTRSYLQMRWRTAKNVKNSVLLMPSRLSGFDSYFFGSLRARNSLRVVLCEANASNVGFSDSQLSALQIALNTQIFYSLNKTQIGVASCTFPGIQFANTCIGAPLSCCEFKMVSASLNHEDFEVEDEPPRGELYVRGSNVFSKYFADETATAQSIRFGWFRSQRMVELYRDGSLCLLQLKSK